MIIYVSFNTVNRASPDQRRGVTRVGAARGAVWNADILRGGSSMIVVGGDGGVVGT